VVQFEFHRRIDKLHHYQDFHWHDSRHSFANSLIMAEVGMRTVAQLPAHKNASDGDAVPSAFAVPRTGGSRTVV